MIFQDNVIKKYLKNVYFVTGTPCGGKTTISRALGKKYNIPVYDVDEKFPHHRVMSDPECQPSMNQRFNNADEFFGRSVEEYRNWLIHNTREQMDFVIMDLIRMSQDQIVLCDCHLTLEEAKQITDPSRIVFMLREPKDLVEDYCNRPDHQDFSEFIRSASDFEKAKATCNETLFSLNHKRYNEVKNSDYFWLERDNNRSVDETVALVEKHFGLDVKIVKLERGTKIAEDFVKFVEACSWMDAREHIAHMVRDWVFTDWEAMFVAIKDDKIIGMTSIMKTDYYPVFDIYPWVSSVFVSDEYRGHRVSEKLIACANKYAREQGFERTYIPSEFFGLYEQYGYHYLKDIVNYGNGVDHLFVKELV